MMDTSEITHSSVSESLSIGKIQETYKQIGDAFHLTFHAVLQSKNISERQKWAIHVTLSKF